MRIRVRPEPTSLLVAHAQRVQHVAHAAHVPHHVLGAALLAPGTDAPGERDVTTFDLHFDLAGVDHVIIGQPLAHFLEQPRIGGPVARAETAKIGLAYVIAAAPIVTRVIAAVVLHTT